MRVLLDPTYFTGDIMNNSLSLAAIATARALSARSDVHVILPVPAAGTKYTYPLGAFAGVDTVVTLPYQPKFMGRCPSVEWWDLFNMSTGTHYYDVVLGFTTLMLPQIDGFSKVGYYVRPGFVPDLPSVCAVLRPTYLLCELLGGNGHELMLKGQLDTRARKAYFLPEMLVHGSYPVMFLTKYQRSVAQKLCAGVLSLAGLRALEAESAVIPHPIDMERIRFVQRANPDTVRVMYASSFTEVKNYAKIGAMFQKVYSTGRAVQMVASLPIRQDRLAGAWRDKARQVFGGGVEVHLAPPKDTYHALLEGADVFVAMSNYESCGISYLEQLASGQVGIYLKKPWIEGVLPPDYPFVCDTEEEVYARLLWVVDNLAEAQRRTAYVQGWLKDTVSYPAVAQGMKDYLDVQFRRIVERDRWRLSSHWVFSLLQERLTGPRYRLSEIARMVQSGSSLGVDIMSKATPWRHTVRRIAQVLGYRDTLDDDVDLVFVKE